MKTVQTACHDCGVIIDITDFDTSHQYACPRCRSAIYHPGEGFNIVIAMIISSFLFFIPVLIMPIMTLKIMDTTHSVTLLEAVWFFAADGHLIIALIATACGVVIPLILLDLIFMMLIPIKLGYSPKRIRTYFRLYLTIKNWGMAEVYLVSIFVAIIKLDGMAELSLDFGLYSFIFFLITFYISIAWFNPRDLWSQYDMED